MTAEGVIERPGMARGGRQKDREGPERRCLATGESAPAAGLIRFALSPAGEAVPDLAGRLPGRGAWLTADRALVEKAVKKKLFSRAFRQPVTAPDDLADRLEAGLAQRLIDAVSLARKAGQAVAGADKVRARIEAGKAAVLLQARDGAPGGRAKLTALARAAGEGRIAEFAILDASELGLAFGREFAIHAALDAGGFVERVCADAMRLSGLRNGSQPGATSDRGPVRAGKAPDRAADGLDESEGPHRGTREQDDL